ncbi:flagellar motor protein MotB [Hwanghaeella sp.]|uniref:flagellar motor protein MotB n=1 Tax=Hwanghaeella sp. TaxID=2605943 RepID=UPI003CCBE8F6
MIDPGYKSEPEDKIEKSPAWLVSMGDVTALMLTFFVMLFSMSYVKSERWDEIISLLNRATEPSEIQKPIPTSERAIPSVEVLPGLSTDYLHRILQEKLSRDPILASARITPLEGQVVISLPSDVLFASGSVQLGDEALAAVRELAGVLAQVGNQAEIVGHTDPLPPPEGSYPSNWDLSLARALRVANSLTEAGYRGRFAAIGMGDSRFRHLDPSLPEERRYELARRVDVVLRSEAGGQ